MTVGASFPLPLIPSLPTLLPSLSSLLFLPFPLLPMSPPSPVFPSPLSFRQPLTLPLYPRPYPLNPARGLGSNVSSQRVRTEPGRQTFLVRFQAEISAAFVTCIIIHL